MSVQGDDFLFLIPSVGEAVAAARFEPDQDLVQGDHGVDEILAQLVLGAIEPALRTIILMGYRPWKIEMGTDASHRIEVRLGLDMIATVPGTVGDATHWSGNGVFTVIIHTYPYHAPNSDEPDNASAFRPHKLTPPPPNERSGQWSYIDDGTGSAQNWQDLPTIEPAVFQLSLLQEDTGIGLAASLAQGPVANLVNDCLPVLEAAYNSGTDLHGRGLVWLFDPSSWYPLDEDGTAAGDPKYLRLMKGIAEEAHLPANAAGLRGFLEGQIAGNVQAAYVLWEVTNKKTRSRSRARRFLRMVRKWAGQDDAPVQEYPDHLDLALRTLGWFDLILALITAGFLDPRGLPDGDVIVIGTAPEVPVSRETLLAQKLNEREVRLRVFATDGNPDMDPSGETDGYKTVVHLLASDIALPDPTDIDASIGLRSIESMCTWEYIPANNDNPMPQLLVLAGPGVQITPNTTNLVEIIVLRKQDYGIPAWGAPIVISQLYQPIFVQGKQPAPLDQTSEIPAWIIYPQTDGGAIVHLFTDIDQPGLQPGETPDLNQVTTPPSATITVTVTDPMSGSAAYRLDCDFVTIEEAETPSRPEAVHAILNFWQTSNGIHTKVTRNWWTRFKGYFWETPQIATLFANFPYHIPVTVPNNWNYYAGIPQDRPTHDEDSMRARNVVDLSDLPTVTASALNGRGFTRIANDDPSLVLDYQWTAIDWFLIPVDILVGFTPVGNAIDVIEFIYAWNTMQDRYGRPITQLDLWMMGIGAAVPFAGTAIFRSGADAGVSLGRIWRAAPGADAAEATTLVNMARGAGETGLEAGAVPFKQATEVATSVAVRAGGALDNVMDAAATVTRTDLNPADLMNAAGDACLSPQLQRDYQHWLAQQIMTGGVP